MIRDLGGETTSSYSQTFNVWEVRLPRFRLRAHNGPLLIRSTGGEDLHSIAGIENA